MIQIKDCVLAVKGNREDYLVEGMPPVLHDGKIKLNKEIIERNDWVKNSLSTSTKMFIYGLPKKILYPVDGKVIYIAHYPMNEDGRYRKHIKQATLEDNQEMFAGIEADVYFYGHTHEVVYHEKNQKYYINPGALGCPGKTNQAPYGILEIEKNKIQYQQCSVTYPVEEVIEDIEKVAFPGYESVLKLFYGKEECIKK